MADYNADQMGYVGGKFPEDESHERFEQIAKQEDTQPTLDEQLRSGYVVGLTTEGKFVFQLVGAERTLDSIVASHRHANDKIEQIWDSQFNRGLAVQNLIAKTLTQLNQKLDTILKDAPENQL